ncbi:MAG: hypothetical protein K6L80_06630 [Agarilytica sp.]
MKKLFIVFTCLFLLSACSTRLAYNFLDFIIKWYVGQYVSLDSKQKRVLSGAADEFHQWHRRTQLDIYADYIDYLLKRLDEKAIDGKWVHAQTDVAQDFIDVSAQHFKPTIIDIMHSLSDEQAKQVLKNLAKDRKDYKKKYVDISAKKQAKRRKNELLDYIAPFFGSFTKEQKKWIADWSTKDIKPYETLTLKQQEIWSDEVERALEARQDKAQLDKNVDEIILYRTDDWDPDLEAILDHNQAVSYALIARLVNNQTPSQRKKMFSKLKSYRDDFRAMAKKAKTPQ